MNLDDSKILLENMYDALNAQDLEAQHKYWNDDMICLLYTSPSPRDPSISRMPSSA